MQNIYVGNLSYDTNEADIRAAFERYGDVNSVTVVTDQMTGKSRGFAFVKMRHLDDADEAIVRLNGSTLGGRRLVVNEAHGGRSPAPSFESRPRQSASRRANLWNLV